MLFGVAGGMADWLNIDPSIVRLVWVLLLLGGVGFILYIVAAIIVPEAPIEAMGTGTTGEIGASDRARWEARRATQRQGSGNAGVIFGVVLVVAGAWILLSRYLPALDTAWVLPGALIVIGAALMLGALGRSRNPGA